MSTWSLYLLPLLEGDFSGLAFTGILIGFIVGTTASMCFLFLAVEALVCFIASNVDGSELLS